MPLPVQAFLVKDDTIAVVETLYVPPVLLVYTIYHSDLFVRISFGKKPVQWYFNQVLNHSSNMGVSAISRNF